jgi:hypothetical protein
MVIVKCDRCMKIFKYKYLLERHRNAKRSCEPINKDPLEAATEKLAKITDKLTQKLVEENHEDKVCNNSVEKKEYKCMHCNKVFTRKFGLDLHLGIATKQQKRDNIKPLILCRNIHDNISIYERELNIVPKLEKNKCRFCNTKYTKASSYSRHQKQGCKAKDEYEEQLEKKVLKARSNAAQNIQHQTINNNYGTTNNTININLPPMRAFGDENLDYITTKCLLMELQKCTNINDMTKIIGNFTKMIHCNPAHPENHNVEIRSLNSGYARIFNGKAFEDRQALDVQDKILQRVGTFIATKCDEYGKQPDSVPELSISDRKLESVQEKIAEDIIEQLNYVGTGGISNRTFTNYRAQVKSTLYSNKNEIQSTQRLRLADNNQVHELE